MQITESVFQVTRVVVASEKPYADVVAKLESLLGVADAEVQKRLIGSNAPAEEAVDAIKKMLGPSGLMVVAKVNQGALLSLLGKPKRSIVFLLANPMIGNKFFEVTSAVGAYVPVRFAVFEDIDGVAKVAYDKPSSLLAQFQSPEIDEIAKIVDGKLAELAKASVE